MRFLVSLKVVRLLLAISVSFWLAGGCLFGCSNTAIAANVSTSNETAIEGESCHSAQSHHCCSKQKQAKQSTVKLDLTNALPGVSSLPRGGMTDCPLVVNATAVTSKNSGNSPDHAGATTAALPLAGSVGETSQKHVVTPFLPNRGPTYLRCCVFRI